MNTTLNIPKKLVIFGIPLGIIGTMIWVSKSSLFTDNISQMSLGITVDLLLTAPFLYFLLIRKTKIPKTTVVPFVIVGMLVCSFIIPESQQYYLNIFKTWGLPIIELSVLGYIIFHLRKVIKQFKLNKNTSVDFHTTLKKTCQEFLPKVLVNPFVTEISVFYYGFINWKKRVLKRNEFSYHKESGNITLYLAIIFIIGIETVVLHTVIAKWSIMVAWILTGLSIYSGIQLFGFLKSITKRPIVIENNMLYLRYGIMKETTIDIEKIDRIELSSTDIELNDKTRKLSFLGPLESHNTIINLKEEHILTGLYGIKKSFKTLALYIDKKSEFKKQIDKILNTKS